MAMTIAVVVGSLRAESINRRTSAAVVRLGPIDVTSADVSIADLPLYNQDQDALPLPS